ncbi:hypothetical protein BH10BAC3_BH10BAC3_09840 [soil metagenome]
MKLLYRDAVKKIIASFFGKTIRLTPSLTARLLLLVMLFGAGGKVWGQNYQSFDASTTNAWTASKWSTSSATNACVTTGLTNAFTPGRIIYLCTVNGTGLGAVGITAGGITATENYTHSLPTGTFATGGAVITINVASAKILDLSSTLFSTTAGTGIIKAGTGTLISSNGNAYPGGFTMNAGTMIIGGTLALGGGGTSALSINGGAFAASATRTIPAGRYSAINIGGDFTVGATGYTSNISFADNVALGNSIRNINLSGTAGTSTYTFSGVISGAGGGITVGNTSGNGILVLSGNNTYTGTTTVTSGELRLNPSANTSLSGACTFNGGTLATTGIAATRTITFGSINISDNSTLAFGTGSHTLTFSSLGILTSGKMLTITGWTGTSYAVGTTTGTGGKLFIGSSLTAAQLAQIRFFNGTNYYAAVQLGTGEIVPAAILVATNPGNQTAGTGFSVTVTAKDLDGNARNLTNATGITLTSSTNTIGGTTTGTISAGGSAVTISGVTLTAGANATITATRSSGDQPLPGTSGTFNVAAATTPVINGLVTATGTATFNLFSTNYGTASAAQQFDISGSDITAATGITVTPPAGFEVSKTSAVSGFAGSGNAITVGAAGTIASTNVWLRLAASAPVSGTYDNQTLALTSTGATTVNLATAASGNTVAKLPLTVQANSPVPKTFGTSLNGGTSTAFSVTSGTLVSGESITSVTLAYGSGASACDPPGNTTNVVTPSAATGSGGFSAANYFITYLGGDINVSKATPVITVTGATSYAYDGNPQGPDTYDAPAAGTCATASTGTVTYTYSNNGGPAYGPSTTKPSAVGTYKVSATIAADANYNGATSVDYAFAIIAGTITLSPATQTQGPFCNASGNQIILTYTTTGTVTAPFIQLSNALGSFASGTTNISPDYISGTGPYNIAATFALGQTAGTGYRARIISIDATPVISLDNGSNITVTQATTPTVSITSSPAAVAGTTTICAGTNVTFTPAPANLSGATYTITWWKGGAGTGTNLGTSATYSSTSLSNSDVITCIMENIAGGCTTGPDPESNAITMLVNPLLTPSVSIASSPAAVSGITSVCAGNNITFTPTPTNGGASPTYHWWKNGIGVTDLGISATYSNTTLTNGNTITCVMTSNAICASPTTVNAAPITIAINTPASPTGYSGTNTVYPGQTGVTYSVTNVAGVTYTWAYSGTGYTIASGQGTNSITIDYAVGATAGTLSVTPSVSGCNGTPFTQAITVAPINDLCGNATALTINAAAVTGTFVNATATTGATSYAPTKKDVWYKFTPACTGSHTITVSFASGPDIDFDVFSTSCPSSSATAPVTAHVIGGTSETITANFTGAFTYYIRMIDYNTNAAAFAISISGNAPVTPGTITGAAAPCVGVSTPYSIAAVTNASSYTWSLPSGWTGTSTTNSITVTPSTTTGNVSVIANNCYGSSTANTLAVTPLAIPATPGSITGSGGVCASTTGLAYSITAVPGATSYNWSVPSDWSAPVGTASITTNSGVQSGNVSVTATNGCGTSAAQSVAVTTTTITPPTATAASAITGSDFIANWGVIGGATGYYVDVYQQVVSSTTITEGFSAGTSAPAGWIFTSIGSTYTSASNFGASSPALQLDATNDRVQTISLAGAATNLSFWLKGQGSTTGSSFLIEGYNGSSWQTIQNITTIPITGTTYTYTSATTPSLAASLTQFRFTFTKSSGNLSFDDVSITYQTTATTLLSGYQNTLSSINSLEVTGLSASTVYTYVVRATNGTCSSANSNTISVTTNPPCTPTATITSFKPATGPAKTLVTITGTNFTSATAVKFGSTAALSFTPVSSTTIIAEVPISAPTDLISVTVGGCDAVSSTNFTVINQTGCGSGGTYTTDLFISEVFDSDKGSVSYIEIFNGTSAAIPAATLNTYTVRFITGISTINDYAISSASALASGAVYVLRVGDPTVAGTTICGSVQQQSYDAGSGFNGNDRVYLRKAGADIDYIPNPNYPGSTFTGFSQVRNSTTTGPTTSYTASQWTTYDVESCANLGIAPFTVAAPSVTISSQPADVDCATVTFSVGATASPATVSSYLWKYNDPATMAGWSNASGLTNGTVTVASGTATATMTITGLTAQIRNYQFYCEVTKISGTSCIQSSNAAQFSYSSLPVYRSKTGVANGDWVTASNWEMANSLAGPWSNACTYPIASNSSEVLVQTGTSIFLNNTVDIDKITVDPTATLELRAAGFLTVYDSTATADFTINGTLYDRASATYGVGYGPGATWLLGANGTIIKSNASSTAAYRNNYYTGISNIPSTASWYYRYNADGNPSNAAVDMFYPNLYFENTTGTLYSFNLATTAFTGTTGGYSTVKGNLSVGNTGLSAVQVYNSNTNIQPMLLLGNLFIGAGSSLLNTSYDGGTNTSHGFGSLEVRGNIANAGTLTTTYNAANSGSGKLLLTGSTNQVISGAGTFNLYDVTVNNGVGGSVTLNTDILVPNTLTLTNGIVTTAATPNGLLTLGSATNAVAGTPGTSAFVNGPMAKQTITGSTEFMYPVGKTAPSTQYKPCYVLPVTASGTTTYTGEFFPANPAAAYPDPFISTLIYIYRHYYWKVDRGNLQTGTARVALDYNPAGTLPADWTSAAPTLASPPSIPAATNVAVVKDFGTYWNFTKGAVNFNDQGPMYEARYYTTTGKIYTDVLNAFSPFTFGFDYNTILPVSLLSFTGQLVVADGKLNWKVADSKDLDGFELEYSRDGRRYENLVAIKSNSGTSYSFLHAALPAGANYYRLLVKDKNGKTFYSQVVLLNVGKLHTYLVGVTPTIVSGELIPVIFSAKNQPVQAMITDVLGRRISNEKSILQAGGNQWRINTQSLAKGMYFITLLTEDGLKETRKFLKE